MRPLVPVLLGAVALASCGGGGDGDAGSRPAGRVPSTTPAPSTTAAPGAGAAAVPVKTMARGLRVPWGLAFLPDGSALVAERTTGRILRIAADGGSKRVVQTIPGVDTNAGEGGLLGLTVSPGYRSDRLVYAYYTTAEDNRIARFRLGQRPRPILTGLERGFIHNGGRIAFGPDGRLYAGVGDTGDPSNSQDRLSLNGKILRMDPDGGVPDGNPFRDSLVWSLGHRNVQGFDWDARGRMWAAEFGQNTWDEVNLIRAGRNYGWPEVEGRGSTAGGRFTNPKLVWRTSEASPSGVAIRGGRLYVGALQGRGVWRVPLRGGDVGEPRLLFGDRWGRVRTVEAAPGGGLWITTSNRDGRGSPRAGDDKVIRVPAR